MKRIIKILLICYVILPIIGHSQADIRIYIDNPQDSVFYFCKYIGSRSIVIDTMKLKNDMIQYKNKEKLPEGIYLLTNDKYYQLTEILVGKQQKFAVKINDIDDLNSYKVKGRAKETEVYFKLMAKEREYNGNVAALSSEIGYFPENQMKIDSMKKDLALYEESLKIKRKNSFINIVINSVKRNGMDDYWDDIALNDARILTYPLIENKLDYYFDNLYDNVEKINSEIDKLIARTGDCIEVRDYLIWYFYKKYYNPKYMNLDDIYIHIVDDYFLKYEMRNVSESVVNLMADRANYLENLKIGAKLPEIGNLYHIDAEYITVIFYDKTCQKCAQEGRILEEIRTRHPEMIIFPVEINSTNLPNLLSMYDIQTTPMIYLLDRNKKIIAKRMKAGQLEQLLNMD